MSIQADLGDIPKDAKLYGGVFVMVMKYPNTEEAERKLVLKSFYDREQCNDKDIANIDRLYSEVAKYCKRVSKETQARYKSLKEGNPKGNAK